LDDPNAGFGIGSNDWDGTAIRTEFRHAQHVWENTSLETPHKRSPKSWKMLDSNAIFSGLWVLFVACCNI